MLLIIQFYMLYQLLLGKICSDEYASIAYGETKIFLERQILIRTKNFCKMLELLRVNSNDLVLDRLWLGYSSAILSQIAEVVIALEENFFKSAQKLSETSIENTVIYEGLLDGINYEEKVDALIIQGGSNYSFENSRTS